MLTTYWDAPTKFTKLLYVMRIIYYSTSRNDSFSEEIVLDEMGRSVGDFSRVGCYHLYYSYGSGSVPDMSLFLRGLSTVAKSLI
jgi:hypothetical protein